MTVSCRMVHTGACWRNEGTSLWLYRHSRLASSDTTYLDTQLGVHTPVSKPATTPASPVVSCARIQNMLGRKLAGSRWKSRVSIGINVKAEESTSTPASTSEGSGANGNSQTIPSGSTAAQQSSENSGGPQPNPAPEPTPSTFTRQPLPGCPYCDGAAAPTGSTRLHRGPQAAVQLCPEHARAHLSHLAELSASCAQLMRHHSRLGTPPYTTASSPPPRSVVACLSLHAPLHSGMACSLDALASMSRRHPGL